MNQKKPDRLKKLNRPEKPDRSDCRCNPPFIRQTSWRMADEEPQIF